MVGKKYGKLTVVSIEKKNKSTMLNCKCDCGNHVVREVYMIGSGVVKSCGCSKGDAIKKYNNSGKRSKGCYKDGRSLHPLYGTWFQMISRCENPNHKHYDRYGGRGISVCEEWHDFWKFVEWSDSVGCRPNGFTLDRIDNNGNYEPTNCRWANWRTQKTNTSANVFIEYNGVRKTMIEWSEELKIHPHTLQNRINRNWSVERALTEPVSENSHSSRGKRLFRYDNDGKVVAIYNSLSELEPEFNKHSVCNSIYRKRKYKGFLFLYEDE